MPWRHVVSPYRTWISEIMLQQTQVDAVRGYFARFVERFADVHALAAAEERDVLSLWAGLGYYSRARNLHRAARIAVKEHGGLPATRDGWRALPGVGRYTLGAVRSIAYGEPCALVDGNVLRVVSRIGGLKTRRGEKSSEDRIWAIAEALHADDPIVRARPGDFNQALMELGATVCTPAPKCGECPVRAACAAAATKDPAKYPLAKAAVAKKRVRIAAAWIEQGGKVLLVERVRPGLWAGMWALPSASSSEELASLLEEIGAKSVRVGAVLRKTARTLTHRQVEIVVHEVSASGALRGRFVPVAELGDAGMPSAFRAALP
ncbi:MAG: A/G-specific adenine glycosylase [Deltaproteobacteria bacterium]|nr:A/G-specific adenine glycosylase [Deltaproteobacteria bacterium]